MDVIQIYRDYSGNSLYMTLFLCALGFLFFREKERSRKAVLVYSSVVLLLLFFFPLFSYLMIKVIFEGEVYYRFLWLLPVNVVIAYSIIKIVLSIRNKRIAAIFYLFFILILTFGGNYVFDNPNFKRAENSYHLPQTVIDICDAIEPEEDEDWVNAAMPAELLSFVRQYTTRIHMPYGRAVLIDRWNLGHPMFETMEEEQIDFQLLSSQADEYACDYVVLQESKTVNNEWKKYGFELIDTIDGYCIFNNIEME